jgi:hypothetical protein
MANAKTTTVTISNICDGNARTFRVRDGRLSDAGLRHARSIGFGGPKFAGPGADAAIAGGVPGSPLTSSSATDPALRALQVHGFAIRRRAQQTSMPLGRVIGATTMANFWIGDGYDQYTVGQVGFLVLVSPEQRVDRYNLREHPAHTNQSHHPQLHGWCGTTDNVAIHACGLARVVRVASNGRAMVTQIKGAEQTAALEALGLSGPRRLTSAPPHPAPQVRPRGFRGVGLLFAIKGGVPCIPRPKPRTTARTQVTLGRA